MQGAREHVKAGITTATEGGFFDLSAVEAYTRVTAQDDFPLRIVGILAYMMPATRELIGKESPFETDLFKITRAKIWADGSIQGGTALLTEPYYNFPQANPPVPVAAEEMKQQVLNIYQRGRELSIHCNGDLALDWALDAIEHAQVETGLKGMRPQIVHGQVIRPDQFERMRDMKRSGIADVTLSMFAVHVAQWGDAHRDIFLGPERAAAMDAFATANRVGLVYAAHNDAPVSLPNPLYSMWAMVNRQTPSGQVLGPDERISAEQALAAYTRNAAYQLGMEDDIGTLEVGKYADLTVLSANPLKVDADAIKDIAVMYTVLGGNVVEIQGR